MPKKEWFLAISLEMVGACVVSAGIIVEVATGAEIGYVVITTGALTGMIGAMLFAKIFRKH